MFDFSTLALFIISAFRIMCNAFNSLNGYLNSALIASSHDASFHADLLTLVTAKNLPGLCTIRPDLVVTAAASSSSTSIA